MIITNLKVGTKGRIILYADDKYICHLHPEVVARYNIKVNSQIDDDLIHTMSEESNLYYAKQKALNLLSYRDRSKKEIFDKIKKSFNNDELLADTVTQKMQDLGLVNDKNLASLYIEQFLFRKKYSISRTRFEILKKGIDEFLIDQLLDNIDIDETKNVLDLLNTKFKNKFNDEKNRRRTISALQRLGYSWETIKSALNEFKNLLFEDE